MIEVWLIKREGTILHLKKKECQMISFLKQFIVLALNSKQMMSLQVDSDDDEYRSHRVQSLDNLQPINYNHPKFGKMIILYQNQQKFISLGPHYWCFIPTLIIFIVTALMLTLFVFEHSSNLIFQLATIIIEGTTCAAYLAVALSDPGIIFQENYADTQINPLEAQTKKLCRKCNIRVSRKSYHCIDCDVCIEGYDHHCPWTSKCIGKKNLCKFYIFIAMVPIFLVYTFLAFASVMSNAMISGGNKYVRSY